MREEFVAREHADTVVEPSGEAGLELHGVAPLAVTL
jgi:hypothetical protein